MSWGAKGQQTAGEVYSGSLTVVDHGQFDAHTSSLQSVGVMMGGARATVSFYGATVLGPPVDPTAAGGCYRCYKVRADAPGATSSYYVAIWFRDWHNINDYPMVSHMAAPAGTTFVTNTTTLTVSWSITLSGCYRRAQVTQTSFGPNQTALRHPAQRTGQGKWCGDASTTVTATCGTATATGNWGLATETDLSAALGLSLSLELGAVGSDNTMYGSVTVDGVDFGNCTYYRVHGDDGNWHWMGTTLCGGYSGTPSNSIVDCLTIGSGSTLAIQWGGHQSGSHGSVGTWVFNGTLGTRKVTFDLALWKQNKKSRGGVGVGIPYGTYDSTQGEPFDLGLYIAPGSSAAAVSVGPGTHTYVETGFTPALPDDKWKVFANGGSFFVNLRKDWLAQNGEDVPFTNPLTTVDMSVPLSGDIRQMVTFHPLTTALNAAPWASDYLTFARNELNLDMPDGTHQPSAWGGVSGATVAGTAWGIGAGGGTVQRGLATWRRNMMRRLAAHLWAGSGDQQEVSLDWPIQTNALLSAATLGIDPKWDDPGATPWPGDEVGVAYQDVTDWRGISCQALSLSGATGPLLLAMELSYRTLSGVLSYYTDAGPNFGASGDASATWSAQKAAVIYAILDSGVAVFDLAPNVGSTGWDLELVEEVRMVFPAGAQSLTFNGWTTVPFDASHNIVEQRMRIAQLHSTDLWGAELAVDDMANYKPSYLYWYGTDRNEVGFRDLIPWQDDPDTEYPMDRKALKSLANWPEEAYWGQCLYLPTWQQTNVDRDLKDTSGVTLGTLAWGDWDKDGGVLHVGVNADNASPPNGLYIACDTILQGGVRGIAKAGGVRQVNLASSTFTLQKSTDGGATKTTVATTGTDACGGFRTGSGQEKAPLTYYLGSLLLGGFVNSEELWWAIAQPIALKGIAAMMRPGTLEGAYAYPDAGGVLWWNRVVEGLDTVGTRVQVDNSRQYAAANGWWDGPVIRVIGLGASDGIPYLFTSEDQGNTWTARGAKP